MSIVTILSILVSSMIVYAAPLIFTSIGGAYSEHAGVVNVALKESWLWEPSQELSLT